jgi:hypothetical protein
LDLTPTTPEVLAVSETIMTGFMCEPTKTFKTFAELIEIFSRDQATVAGKGDPSHDLRVIGFASAMLAGEWECPIVFRRDDDGRIGDGVHRGIAYLRCIGDQAELSQLPPLLLAPLGSWQWPPGLKALVQAEAAAN